MSVNPASSDCKDWSPTPVVCGSEEKHPSLQMSSAEMPHTETVSPLPSSTDLLIQDSPDSSTSPKGKQSTSAENSATKKEDKVLVEKQKARTVFSSAQLCVLNDRFQRQKYLSLQQMQELSNILNLSYKQVVWLCHPGWIAVAPSGLTASASQVAGITWSCHHAQLIFNLPMWSNQTWNNSSWSNQTQNIQSWSNHSWNAQTGCTQSWKNQAWNKESLQFCLQFQPNSPASDLEAALEAAGEGLNTTRYCGTSQTMDLSLNYSTNMQPEDV
uniref:Homeobox domain-containing protein n=1 Tax=Rhinopithecus roxellana TaxID=61622 RepID=A0A2K6P942_RHIRO